MNFSWNKMTYVVVITFTIIVILVTSVILVVEPGQSSPITRSCTNTIGEIGEQIETCHVVERSGSRLINKTEITTSIRGPVSITINDPGKVDEITTLTFQGNTKCTITTDQGGVQIETCHVVVQSGRALINITETTIRGPRSIDINEPGKVIKVTTLATLTSPGDSITQNCTKTTSQGGKKVTETCHVVGQSGGRHINTTKTTIRGSGYIENNESGPVLHYGNTYISKGNNFAG